MNAHSEFDFEAALVEAEAQIRGGKSAEARCGLKSLALEEVPRKFALRLAHLLRRAEQPLPALRILNPIVRPSHKKVVVATNEEKIEYGFCLSNIGAYQEALKLLDSVDAVSHPQALLAKTFALVVSWSYAETIPVLKAYCESNRIDAYQRVVGKANLLAAYVWERDGQNSEKLISDLLSETEGQEYTFLRGKILTLRAQNAIYQERWQDAGPYLNQAQDHLKRTGGLDDILIGKWRAVERLLRENGSNRSLMELHAIRKEAIQIHHWETVRHCDFFEAIACRNMDLATHVYYGTPYPSFRERLEKDFGEGWTLPRSYSWELGSKARVTQEIDFLLRETPAIDPQLKVGRLLHKAAMALASDFYRPRRVTTLHFALYPNAFFNPASSPDRVHQILKRLRQSLVRSHLPLKVEEANQSYTLSANRPVVLHVPLPETISDRNEYLLEQLKQAKATDPFSTRDVGKLLKLQVGRALALVQYAREKGLVIPVGKGRTARYCFANTDQSATLFPSVQLKK